MLTLVMLVGCNDEPPLDAIQGIPSAGAPPTLPGTPAQPAGAAAPVDAGTSGAILRAPVKSWPMFRGNPHQTGVAGAALPETLRVAWERDLGEAILSTAAIVDGVVYVGLTDGFLHAVSLETGKEKWKYATNRAPVSSSPAVADGVVYFGDEDGIFHAITAADGKKKWTFQTDAEVISSATVVGDRVLFGSYDAQLYCLNRAGKVRWKVLTEGRVHASPAVVGNHTFVAGCDAHLRVIDIRKGEELRAVDMGAYCIATPAVAGDNCYLGTFGEEIIGVDWQKGAQLWIYAHEDRHFPFYGSAAITADLVVVGGRDKLVHALDRKTGRRRWEFATKGRIEGSPVIAGERVYVGSMDGRLYVLDLRSGEKVQAQTLGAPITASPAVADGRLVIGTEDGLLYCFAGTSKEQVK